MCSESDSFGDPRAPNENAPFMYSSRASCTTRTYRRFTCSKLMILWCICTSVVLAVIFQLTPKPLGLAVSFFLTRTPCSPRNLCRSGQTVPVVSKCLKLDSNEVAGLAVARRYKKMIDAAARHLNLIDDMEFVALLMCSEERKAVCEDLTTLQQPLGTDDHRVGATAGADRATADRHRRVALPHFEAFAAQKGAGLASRQLLPIGALRAG